MTWQSDLYTFLLLISALVSGAMVVYAWRRRSTPVITLFALLMLAITIWALAYALQLASITLAAILFWIKIEHLGSAFLPALWLLFILAYTGRAKRLSEWEVATLFVIPILTLVLSWTNEFHYLYYRQVVLDTKGLFPVLKVTSGVWYRVHFAYFNLTMVVGLLLLWRTLQRSVQPYRRHVWIILVGALAPVIAGVSDQSPLNPIAPLNLTPIAFIITGLTIGWSLFQGRMVGLVPLAHDSVVEHMRDGVVILDSENRIVDMNPAALRFLGEPGAAPIGQPIELVLYRWPEILALCGQLTTTCREITWSQDPQRYVAVQVTPLFHRGEHFSGCFIIWRDITAQKQAEEAINDALKHFEAVMQHTPLVAIQGFDHDGTIRYWNDTCQILYGYSAAEACGKPIHELLLPCEAGREFEQMLQAVWDGASIQPVEWLIHTRNGKDRYVYSTMFPIFVSGQISTIYCMDVDITQRKQAEALLHYERELFKRIIDKIPIMIVHYDMQGNMFLLNQAFQTATGWMLEEAQQGDLLSMCYPDAAYRQTAWEYMHTPQAGWKDFHLVTKTGSIIEISWSNILLEDGTRIGIGIDLSERRQAEASLRRQNEYLAALHQITIDWLNYRAIDDLLQAIVERATVFLEAPYGEIMLKDGDELVVRAFTANQAFLRGVCAQRDEALLSWQAHDTGQPAIIDDYSAWPDRRMIYGHIPLRAVADFPIMVGQACMGVLGLGRIRPDHRFEPDEIQRGEVFAQLVALMLDNANLYEAARREIAERIQAETWLRNRLRFIQFIQQAANHFIRETVSRLDQPITAVLRDVAELFGVERGYVFLIAPERGVVELSHEWCHETVIPHQGILDTISIADFADFIATLQRGETVHVQTHMIPRTPDTKAMTDILDQLEIKSFVNIPLFISEQLIGWIGFDAVANAVEWSEETVEAFRLTGQLIANAIHRQQAEAQQASLQAQLLQAQKMEAIGHLAGGVAHDFNNILTAIIGNADLALMELSDDHSAYADMQAVQKSARRATHLVRQLLTFARRQTGHPEIVDLNDLVLNITPMLRRLISEQIDLVVLPGRDLCRIRIDPHQCEQVLVNLAVNARDAMPDGGTLTIATINVDMKQADTYQHAGMRAGPYVQLSISDTGMGMTEVVKAHIFEPFFTTKAMGHGTGLGLATCFGIIKQHNGHIQVDSIPGQGSCFKVFLPCTTDMAHPSSETHDSFEQEHGTEVVLLVEDDAEVRQLTARILRNHGYTVLEAVNGQEALLLAETLSRQKFHLLLTDLVMPQLGGLELSRQLLAQRPDLRVLFMSGYTNQPDSINEQLTAERMFLQKPFTPDGLIRQVRQALMPDSPTSPS